MKSPVITDVWSHNIHAEFLKLTSLIPSYPVISLDTEFPGLLHNKGNFSYDLVKQNVEYTKLIQIGITLSNFAGEFPKPDFIWQFNLRFDLDEDKHSLPSIQLLKHAGLDFDKFKVQGIPQHIFREHLEKIIKNPYLIWICFHGIFDFAYLLRLLKNSPLPDEEKVFKKELAKCFPTIYDIKTVIMFHFRIKGGLYKIAETFGFKEIGTRHQAGSDSYVTAKLFHTVSAYCCWRSSWIEGRNLIFGLEETYKLGVEDALNLYELFCIRFELAAFSGYGKRFENEQGSLLFDAEGQALYVSPYWLLNPPPPSDKKGEVVENKKEPRRLKKHLPGSNSRKRPAPSTKPSYAKLTQNESKAYKVPCDETSSLAQNCKSEALIAEELKTKGRIWIRKKPQAIKAAN